MPSARRPLPEALTAPGEGSAGTVSFALPPSAGSSFGAALTSWGRGTGDERTGKGKERQWATHVDAGLRGSQEGQEGVIVKEGNNLNRRGDYGNSEEGAQGFRINMMEKAEEEKTPGMESELRRHAQELGSSSELLQVPAQTPSSSLLDLEKCP